MKHFEDYRHEQKSTIYVAILLFCIVLLLIQMWLFVATLDNFLDGRYSMAIPATFVSLACLAVNIWMLAGLGRLERKS